MDERPSPTAYAAQGALQSNATRIDSEKNPTQWNFNLALLYLVRAVERLERDVDLLHNRIGALRNEVSELPRH